MNKLIDASRLNHRSAIMAFFLLMSIWLPYNCTVKERDYRRKINGIDYGEIHRMGRTSMISIKNVDTISQNRLVNFLHCWENEESKMGHQADLIEICDKLVYIDQVTPKSLYMKARFKPDTTMNHDKRTLILEYLKPNITKEVDYNPQELECIIE